MGPVKPSMRLYIILTIHPLVPSFPQSSPLWDFLLSWFVGPRCLKGPSYIHFHANDVRAPTGMLDGLEQGAVALYIAYDSLRCGGTSDY